MLSISLWAILFHLNMLECFDEKTKKQKQHYILSNDSLIIYSFVFFVLLFNYQGSRLLLHQW